MRSGLRRLVGPAPDPFPRWWAELLVAAVAFQVVQAVVVGWPALVPHVRAYWLVDYSQGFIRRGLAGEVWRRLTGALPSTLTLEVGSWLLSVLLLLAILAVVVRLAQRGTPAGWLTATMLVGSPFVLGALGADRGRSELVGVAVLLAIGALSVSTRGDTFVVAVVAALLMVPTVLLAENTAALIGPWILALVAVRAWREQRSVAVRLLAVGVVAVPLAAVSLFVFTRPTPSAAMVLEVREHASSLSDAVGADRTMFSYLDDSLGGSVAIVRERVTSHLLATTVVAAILVGLVLFAYREVWSSLREVGRRAAGRRWLAWSWVAITVVGLAATGALGVDWLRWLVLSGTSASLTAAFVVLGAERGAAGAPVPDLVPDLVVGERSRGPRALSAAYLVALAPLPIYLSTREAFTYLSLV